MSDPTKDAPDAPEPDSPALDAPSADPTPPDAPAPPPGPIGDETARISVEPEVAWDAPQPSRAMPWEAPVTAAPAAATPGAVPSAGAAEPPAQPPVSPVGGWAEGGTPADPAAPAGVLSAATVGWVLPPPPPVTTGVPGWVIAPTGVRVGAWFIDWVLLGLLVFAAALAFGVGAAALGANIDTGTDSTMTIAYTVLVAGLGFLYFVGLWTSEGKATLGMKAFKLQVANAADGKRLEIGPAVIRWFGLGYFLTLFGVVPALGNVTSLVNFVWWIVLLVTVVGGSMHQGFHDRWAKSVVVRPEGAGSGRGIAVACLLVVGIFLLIAVLAVGTLVYLGPEIEEILRTMGEDV